MKDKTLQGNPQGQFNPEELKAEQERIRQEKLQIISDLNKIKYPLNVTVMAHGKSWTIRNKSFWDALKQNDDEVVAFLENYIAT